jgi:hypothetical protein
MHLLTPPDYSHKMQKGLGKGIAEAVLYLSPRTEAASDGLFVNLCPRASDACFDNCLVHSGMMTYPAALAARIRKTRLLVTEPATFGRLLVKDIAAHLRWARKRDLAPAFRFNGTSDFYWEHFVVPHLGTTVHEHLIDLAPDAIVSEYTKREYAMYRWLRGEYPENLHMTFSLHEQNERHAREVLRRGGNVAVVFRVKRHDPLPRTWWGHHVIDGDTDDLRWLDPRPSIVGLRYKRIAAWSLPTPFVIDPNEQQHTLEVAA